MESFLFKINISPLNLFFFQRPLFRHYYKGTDAVVFVIDSADRERLDELSYDVIRPAFVAEELVNAVFLFLANKQDLPEAMTVDEITDKLSLKNLKHNWSKFKLNLFFISSKRYENTTNNNSNASISNQVYCKSFCLTLF